jgi:hypothetical protein
MLRHDDKAILFNEDEYKKSSLFKKIRAWWWDCWLYDQYNYSWLYRLRWKVTHWWRKDHWVKTNLSCDYHDKVQLMDDALFSLVENYVAKDNEDAFSNVVVEEPIRSTIIEIIHFYRIRRPELMMQEESLMSECFGPVEMEFLPLKDREGFGELKMNYKGDLSEEEREAKIRKMRDLETQIYEETQDMLKKCIDVRAYLWT